MGLISETLQAHLPGKKKKTTSGWICFNAVCCQDDRQRGGFIVNGGDAVSYHCFNCGFKCSWQPGRQVSAKMTKFMRALNLSDDMISTLRFEAFRLNDATSTAIVSVIPTFGERAMPIDAEPIANFLDHEIFPAKLLPVIEYINSRNLYLEDYPFYWTPKAGFSNRLIIPFFYKGQIVGYTARAVGPAALRYVSEQQPGYVFNLDKQSDDRTFVIVCEGPIDAISIDGCALLGSEIKDSQNWLLKQLGKELVLVPDKDHEGPKSVEAAIELGWSVSMPDWPDGVKDINDAVQKLGRLATMWLIVQSKHSNTLKIQLRAKKWFKDINAENN
jgi:hypothetical protein